MAGKKGRPLGHRLSEDSKRKISETKKGQQHSQNTKDKISRALTIHFRKQHPLSEDIIRRYASIEDESICNWIQDVCEELDNSEDILTGKVFRNASRIEMACGHIIETFSHNINPELIFLFKEACEKMGVDPQEYFLELGIEKEIENAWEEVDQKTHLK